MPAGWGLGSGGVQQLTLPLVQFFCEAFAAFEREGEEAPLHTPELASVEKALFLDVSKVGKDAHDRGECMGK